MFLLLLLPLTAVLVPSASPEAYCTAEGGILEKSYIDGILKEINNKRKQLVQGTSGAKDATDKDLPQATAMNKLAWGCDLEALALDTLKTCPDGPATTPASDDKQSVLYYNSEKEDSLTYVLFKWLGEIDNKYPDSLVKAGDSVTFKAADSADFVEWANLMRHDTSHIGCAELFCPDDKKNYVVCITDKGAFVDDDPIYNVGDPCDTSTDGCTNNSPNTYCNQTTGLCEEPVVETSTTVTTTTEVTTAVTTTTTAAETTTTTEASYPGELPNGTDTSCTFAGMTDELRMHFLDTQNYRRSILAKGQVQRPSGNYLPTGANIIKLRLNCILEEKAIREVRQCPTSKTPDDTYGKNFDTFASSTVTSTYRDAIKKAVTNWWKVVRTENNGPGMQVTFRSNHVGQPVETYTQIAWAKTTDLGCAIAKCSSSYTVICLYDPKGNIVDQPMYTKGSPCAACPTGTTCDSALGLCVQSSTEKNPVAAVRPPVMENITVVQTQVSPYSDGTGDFTVLPQSSNDFTQNNLHACLAQQIYSSRWAHLLTKAEKEAHRRSTETQVARDLRVAAEVERAALRKFNETESERKLRLSVNSERTRLRRLTETEESKADRLASNAARMRKMRAAAAIEKRVLRSHTRVDTKQAQPAAASRGSTEPKLWKPSRSQHLGEEECVPSTSILDNS